MKTDILIVGSGCSGLYAVLNLPDELDIMLITKSDFESSDSFLAQGGMCTLKDPSDYNSFFEDTLKAGHYENDQKSVEIMIKSSPDVVKDLVKYGVSFTRDENGDFVYTREGAHAHHRILFHEDITGKEITSHLLDAVKKLKNVRMYEYTTLLDILCDGSKCYGGIIRWPDGREEPVEADYVILATGGIGGTYKHSTNFKHLTGDGVEIARRHNIELKNLDYVQIHPTTLYSDNEEERSFLISESVRGEGARLYDKNMNRFVDELLPRDLLTQEIYKQMEKDGTDFVWEDLRTIPHDELINHFPNIIEHCSQAGYDVFHECIPIVPSQHYLVLEYK